MTLTLPAVLQSDSNEPAVEVLRTYYGNADGRPQPYTGAAFDFWDPSGSREADRDQFRSDDLVAATFLSVNVPPMASYQLLVEQTATFSELLSTIGPDCDLVDVDEDIDDPEWPGWKLTTAVRALDGVGPTTASKLVARKRPKLRPIWDEVVGNVVGAQENYWAPLRDLLQQEGREVHERLIAIRTEASLPDSVSAIRVFDVLAWMEGTGANSSRSA